MTAGTPEAAGRPEWPALDPERPQRISLRTGESTLTTDFADRHRCGFWASLG